MGHLVRLVLHGSTLPILVEEDEEDVFGHRLPAITIGWSEAKARLRRSEKRAGRRVSALFQQFRG